MIGAPTFRIQALILVLILAGTGLIEWSAGRPLICTCGSVKLWTGDAYGPENSQMLADWYSLSHVENAPTVIERYRSTTVALGYTGDSILNSLGDMSFMAIGFWLARLLPTGAPLAFGIALELISLVAIRDNLALNVLMLIYPIDAIRTWQAS